MKKSTGYLLLALMGLCLGAYAVTEAAAPGGLGYILSPLSALLAGAVTVTTFLVVKVAGRLRVVWLLFGLGCFCWAAADAVLAVYALGFGVVAEEYPVVMVLYGCTNLFLLSSVVFFVGAHFKRWNRAKLLLDAVSLTGVCVYAMWVLAYGRSPMLIDMLLQNGVISALPIVADFLVIMGAALWFLSAKNGPVPLYVVLAMLSVASFSLVDLVYWQVSYEGGYYPGSVLDVLAMASLMVGAAGGTLRLGSVVITPIPTGMPGRKTERLIKEGILLLLPLLAMLVSGFVVVELVVYLVAVVIYKSVSVNFEAGIRRELQLRQEKKTNQELSQVVEQNTMDLMLKNEELQRKNEELLLVSSNDMLTSLFNRRYIMDKLQISLDQLKAGQYVALLYIDLDRFKVINDMYGHEMGDKVLVEISSRLKQFSCGHVMLARMGGDEFVMVLTGLAEIREAAEYAAKIIEQCGQNIYVGDYVFSPSMCIGISLYPLDAEDVGTMLKNADIALYHAKEQGTGRFAVFSRMIRQKSQRRNTIEMLLRSDDITSEFTLHYQPQFSIPDQKLIAAEALLRWKSPQLGNVPPAEFIPIAEETDRINHIGLWVLGQATAQIAQWNSRFGGGLVMGVNISPKQLNSSRLMEKLQNLSDSSGFNPAWLDIEITESAALEDDYRLSQIFHLFKAIGMSVSIDDFGAGYSSIMSLKQYSFDRIKIAKPLIDSITASDRNEHIVRALVLLARSIGMKTIAEGVETTAQLYRLAAIGCDQIQGFLLGEPVPAERFEELYLMPARGGVGSAGR